MSQSGIGLEERQNGLSRLVTSSSSNTLTAILVVMCLCSTVHQLAERFDQNKAAHLASELTDHLAAIRTILAQSKSLNRDVRFQVVPNNQRTMKILTTRSTDTARIAQIYDSFRNDIDGFWKSPGELVNSDLRRRVACVIIFLRSNLDAHAWVSPDISRFIHGQNISELRYAGKKYIKIARKLGGIGSILWLPLDIPFSTYERYLKVDDEEVFNHLRCIGKGTTDYVSFVQCLISRQLDDNSLGLSKWNLHVDYGDILPSSERLLLLISLFGGLAVPVDLFKAVRISQRRWTDDGEIQSISATEFGLPPDLVSLLSDDGCITQAGACPEIIKDTLEDGTVTWSIRPESRPLLSSALSPQTEESFATQAMKLICFACPPCYEGKVNWHPAKKKAIWRLLGKATENNRVSSSMKTQVIEALLFFAERDFFTIRRIAVERARSFLRKSMPYYFHASVALFESIIYRLEGSFEKSCTKIRELLGQSQDTETRCDNALKGRLHISLLENKIHRYDRDVSSYMYRWEGIRPLSTFEIEVTRRLQGTAAKYFHSIGDFQTARASLEEHLWLNSTKPIRPNTRLLMVSRLAEIRCELQDYMGARELMQQELKNITEAGNKGRPFRRLLLVLVEANLGLGNLDAADSTLQELVIIEPPELDDLNDQVLYMRRLILVSRVTHSRRQFDEALQMWKFTLQRMEQLCIFQVRHRWTAVVIYLSIAHAQLALGDTEAAKESWANGADISMSERCEYVIPALATAWLQKIVSTIHVEQGWPFRMMLPGGKPDAVWL